MHAIAFLDVDETLLTINSMSGFLVAHLRDRGHTSEQVHAVLRELAALDVGGDRDAVSRAYYATFAGGRPQDLLALGERTARHLGVDVERLRVVCIVLVALLTAAAVAFCGIIAFVGLVVPHLVRMAVGPGHRVLVPASALGGAVLLLLADLVARTAVPYADLPIGMLTALCGGPFFFWLIRRTRRSAGGWA